MKHTKNEPDVTFIGGLGPLTFFNSFEAANEADAKEKAALPPEQHLANVTKRIRDMYADELKKPMDKNLKFRND
jgi:hypothetical protein